MSSIHLTIYCDEVKNIKENDKVFNTFECWDYIGVLIVPSYEIRNLSNDLNALRCPNNNYISCQNNCKFHTKNKIKVHYQKYSDTNIYQIADRWCDLFINNTISNKRFYTHILGINTAIIDKSYFNQNESITNVENNIYNRFFRTALEYPLKTYFSNYDEIIIDNIFHDTGNMDHHPYFKTQPLKKIYYDIRNLKLNCNQIQLLQTDSENCLNPNNTLLQFIDMYLGAVYNCLHARGYKNKEKIAKKLFPIIERCINNPNNSNSRYYKIHSISFFPKNKINPEDDEIQKLEKRLNNFYNNRELKISMIGQLSLFDMKDN